MKEDSVKKASFFTPEFETLSARRLKVFCRKSRHFGYEPKPLQIQ